MLIQAIDFGEICRLRNYSLFKNIINLADVYRLGGNLERAEKMLNEAKILDSKNKMIKTMANLIEKKRKSLNKEANN